MTQDERRLIKTCLCNGFEFHEEISGKTTVKIGDTVFDFGRLNELFVEIEKALDEYERSKEE